MISTITNRDLLRNYKMLKMQLHSGEITEVKIPQEDGSILKITLEKPQTRTALLLEKIRKKPLKHITRPDVDLFS